METPNAPIKFVVTFTVNDYVSQRSFYTNHEEWQFEIPTQAPDASRPTLYFINRKRLAKSVATTAVKLAIDFLNRGINVFKILTMPHDREWISINISEEEGEMQLRVSGHYSFTMKGDKQMILDELIELTTY